MFRCEYVSVLRKINTSYIVVTFATLFVSPFFSLFSLRNSNILKIVETQYSNIDDEEEMEKARQILEDSSEFGSVVYGDV